MHRKCVHACVCLCHHVHFVGEGRVRKRVKGLGRQEEVKDPFYMY